MKLGLGLLLTLPALVAVMGTGCSDLCEGAACGGDDGGVEGGGGADASLDGTIADAGRDVGPSTDGGNGDAADAAETSVPTCNTTGDVAAQPACVTDAAGIFVSPSGNDLTGSGTKESPFKSIGKALGARSAAQSNVFVCAGSYDEHVVLTSAVGLYGGFACVGWTHSTSANPVMIAPTTAGYALSLQAVPSATLEDLQLEAIAGSAAGESSIAVLAATSSATFRRVAITAGNAGPAPTAGAAGVNYPAAQSQAGNGTQATTQSGVPVQMCTACVNGDVSSGGYSGSGGPGSGGNGGPGGPPITGTPGGSGGVFNADGDNDCDNGKKGASTADGAGATADAGTFGALTSSAWVGSSGSAGQAPHVAQGGGGGSGGVSATLGAGGGGGCGGCGGGGGAAGAAGGSSFGVLSFNATLTFDTCTITAGTPSNGGAGGDGQVGQAGGTGGVQAAGGCQGGQGGTGGNGGGGSGGAAGVSVGVGYVGTAPTLTSTTPTFSTTVASGGAAGAHGTPAASKGKAGTNAPTLAL